jgi:2-polyprenyl-3-methyl-5-hydroxy-6-metoxy-1,4-benzoquinol methylase
MPVCRICHYSEGNHLFEVREMMFGLPDTFAYFQCSFCGCLQIREIPADMNRYYPEGYYSYSVFGPLQSMNPVMNFLKRLRDVYAVTGHGLIGKYLFSKIPNGSLRSLSAISIKKDCRILEVGCGVGSLLFALQEIGFTDLTGIDPFILKELSGGRGIKILKKTIHEVEGKWDLIMFHHSYEHLADPLETLQKAASLLDDDGICLIRIPVASCYAWQHYREKWVQVDAPRHFFMHTPESMKILASSSGLAVEKIVYDSTAFQFLGSEQYLRGIPLMAENSYYKDPAKSIFTKKEVRIFQKKVVHLNKENRGDTAAFYLRKSG